jgi:hypothetical protein
MLMQQDVSACGEDKKDVEIKRSINFDSRKQSPQSQ